MTKKITISEAISALHNACEYYDMVHDTGDNKLTEKNKDKVWKGYDTIVNLLHKNKLVE